MRSELRRRLALWLLGLVVVFAPSSRASAERIVPAAIHVTGLGLWRNREMRVALERMLPKDRGPTLGANAIEDTAFLLISVLNDEGFQAPVLTIRAEVAAGRAEIYELDKNLDLQLPRGLAASDVRFEVKAGPRSYVEEVRIKGLQALPTKAGILFFKPGQTLITTQASRAYSPSRVRRSGEKLRDELRRRGYAQAKVDVQRVGSEAVTGGPVALSVKVEEGPLWLISELRYEKADPHEIGFKVADRQGKPWSSATQQDITEEIRRAYYKKGYADVRVRVKPEAAPLAEGRRAVIALIQIEPGPLVTVGKVRLEGNGHTRTSILQRRVRAKTGAPLDPVALERSRYRLSRLGVFDAVDLHYDPQEGAVRDPVYVFREGSRYETNLLAGYGSYEELRGGVEVRQMNLFGLGHQSRLKLIESMKSTSGEYTYTVPELFGEAIDGTARVFGLQRDELAFVRQEYGGDLTLKRQIPWIQAEGTVGYTLEKLQNRHDELTTRTTDDTEVNVASINFGLTRDRRDSPLRPRRGYRWYGRLEVANQDLGGQANYERFELGGAYHFALGQWQFLHIGLTHGVLTTFGTTDATIPVNKRFFSGGDGSIRGYQEGEAAPRGPDGRFVGAKTYTLLNLEYEQVLTESWSAVLFADSLGTAVKLADYPFNERLYSVGIGLRYQTFVGPVRLEYGYNLNRRVGDPSGTWLLSVGYPF